MKSLLTIYVFASFQCKIVAWYFQTLINRNHITIFEERPYSIFEAPSVPNEISAEMKVFLYFYKNFFKN